MPFQIIIADESSKIANPRTKTYRALRQLRAERRIAMNGTPVINRPNDLWAQINFCCPGVLGSYQSFIDRYCIKNYWGGIFSYQRLDEFRDRIKPYLIRKTVEEVLPQLPKKIVSEVPFELSAPERELYDKIKKELL
ncbi:MAG: SNF2-related protein, partial [Nanoarchaeota archaeon]